MGDEIRLEYDSVEDIPEEVDFRSLFVERDGKHHLSIPGLKTEADVSRQGRLVQQEKEKLRATKAKLDAWGDLDPEEVHKQLDRIAELEVAAEGKIDEEKLEQLAEERAARKIASATNPVKRENDRLKTQLAEANARVKELERADRNRVIRDELSAAMTKAGVDPLRMPDALDLHAPMFEITEDGSVVTRENLRAIDPGYSPADAMLRFREMDDKSWMWPENVSGGADGDGGGNRAPRRAGGFGFENGVNPWSRKGWNRQAQGRYWNKFGQEKAAKAAEAAGSSLRSLTPPAS